MIDNGIIVIYTQPSLDGTSESPRFLLAPGDLRTTFWLLCISRIVSRSVCHFVYGSPMMNDTVCGR
jgi:hypothetical protein